MTTRNQRIFSILLVILLGAQMFYTAYDGRGQEEEIVIERPLLIWYTDEDIQPYMETAAADMSARYNVEIRAELVSEVDYIEQISKMSSAETMAGPDVYVASSALLEKAYLAGLTVPVSDGGMETTYSEKAVQAVTYDGQVIARPFYIETCVMLYNRYYVDEDQVPATIDGILSYAENFEADTITERVENIFKWNVADVIDNYMFLGAYTDLGGPSGDDKSRISLDLDKIEECMAYYQSLNAFFAIDADTVTSEEVIREFIDGKTVFAIANVPMLAELDRAVEAGETPDYPTDRTITNEDGEEETVTVIYDPFYQAVPLPALTDSLDTRGLSVTNSVVVNPYSSDVRSAEGCARYLTAGRAAWLYAETGKLPACQNLSGETTETVSAVYEAYEQAAEVPKIMELSNIWLHLEVVLADIWRGADAGEELNEFAGLLNGQLD